MNSESSTGVTRRPAWLPWIAVSWAGALWWTMNSPSVGVWLAGFLVLVLPMVVWIWLPGRPRWLLPVNLAWFLFSTLLAIGVITGQTWQLGILIVSAGILAWHLGHEGTDPHDRATTKLLHLLATASIFFDWLVLLSFGVGVVWLIPWWWLPIIASGVTVLAAIVVWSGAGIEIRQYRRVLPLVGLTGGGLMLAVWWLPTVVYVGSVVAVTALMLWLLTLRHAWLKTWEAGRGRRYLFVGSGVIGLVLLTARWI